MTKKDYQAIARAIYSATVEPDGVSFKFDVSTMRARVREYLADALAADSPRFDRTRFVEACETGRCKGMPRKGD